MYIFLKKKRVKFFLNRALLFTILFVPQSLPLSRESRGGKVDQRAAGKKAGFREFQVSVGVSLPHLCRLPVYLSQLRTASNVLLWMTLDKSHS